MNQITKGSRILHLNYLFTFLISVAVLYFVEGCSDLGCLIYVFYGSGSLALCIILTSVIFFKKNQDIQKRELFYYYVPFLVVFVTMLNHGYITLQILYQILSPYINTINIIAPALIIGIFFIISISQFWIISHFSFLRKSILLNLIIAVIFTTTFANITFEILNRISCQAPDIYCTGETLPKINN